MSGTMPELEMKRIGLTVDDVDAEGGFTGYASLFGQPDLGRDVIERGAFAKSLRARGAGGVRMLFQHDPAQVIGRWVELREDERGLAVRGRLARDVGKAREVLSLMREGALDGLSIGFRSVKARKDAATGYRRILEADLWEISVVTFPMMPGARISSVKSAGQPLPTTREFERWLTRDAGLSRVEARQVIAKGFADLKREREAAQDKVLGLAATIARAANLLQPSKVR